MNIEIEPIEIELEDLVDISEESDIDDDFDWNDCNDEWNDDGDHQKGHQDKHKDKHEKHKGKHKAAKAKSDKSDQQENDKAKGLKKIN